MTVRFDTSPAIKFQRHPLDEVCINTIRTLAIDAIQAANSGHPGTPMAMAPVGYYLWQYVLRPADANEVLEAWKVVMQLHHQPAAIVLTRQDVPTLDRGKYAPAAGVAKGASILAHAPGGKPDVLLMAAGSEVALCAAAHERLSAEGIPRHQHAVVGTLRRPRRGLWRSRFAPRRRGSRLIRAGVDFRLGEVRRASWPEHRDAVLRGLRSAQGPSAGIRFYRGPSRRGRNGPVGKGQIMTV
jgi:hypothetical protein